MCLDGSILLFAFFESPTSGGAFNQPWHDNYYRANTEINYYYYYYGYVPCLWIYRQKPYAVHSMNQRHIYIDRRDYSDGIPCLSEIVRLFSLIRSTSFIFILYSIGPSVAVCLYVATSSFTSVYRSRTLKDRNRGMSPKTQMEAHNEIMGAFECATGKLRHNDFQM